MCALTLAALRSAFLACFSLSTAAMISICVGGLFSRFTFFFPLFRIPLPNSTSCCWKETREKKKKGGLCRVSFDSIADSIPYLSRIRRTNALTRTRMWKYDAHARKTSNGPRREKTLPPRGRGCSPGAPSSPVRGGKKEENGGGKKERIFSTHAREKKNQIYKRKKREIKKKITESSAGIHPRSVRHAKQGGVMGKHPYCTRAR